MKTAIPTLHNLNRGGSKYQAAFLRVEGNRNIDETIKTQFIIEVLMPFKFFPLLHICPPQTLHMHCLILSKNLSHYPGHGWLNNIGVSLSDLLNRFSPSLVHIRAYREKKIAYCSIICFQQSIVQLDFHFHFTLQ